MLGSKACETASGSSTPSRLYVGLSMCSSTWPATPIASPSPTDGWGSLENGRVRFRGRNAKQNNRIQTMTLEAVEFLRRFLLHVLPRGFVKIRYYGFLAHRRRSTELAHCRRLLEASATPDDAATVLTSEQRQAVERRCPLCRQGLLHIVEWLSAAELLTRRHDLTLPDPIDSS